MVVEDPEDPELAAARRLRWRVVCWAVMAAAVFWTLLYRAGAGQGLPEFIYVNF